MKKKILILILAFFFSAAFLMPIGFILSSANHEHVCCTTGEESPAPIVKYLCCVVCLNIHNAKYLLTNCAANSGTSAFSMRVGLYNPTSCDGSVYVHICTTLISLNVRMDN